LIWAMTVSGLTMTSAVRYPVDQAREHDAQLPVRVREPRPSRGARQHLQLVP